jgi:hypothetical protein
MWMGATTNIYQPGRLPKHGQGWAWKEGAFTIRSADEGALRQLVNDRARIARQIRDSELGRLLRENYTPKRQAPALLDT